MNSGFDAKKLAAIVRFIEGNFPNNTAAQATAATFAMITLGLKTGKTKDKLMESSLKGIALFPSDSYEHTMNILESEKEEEDAN